jgi:hypothetical protein
MSHVCLMSVVMESTAPILGSIKLLKIMSLLKNTNNRTGKML